MTDREARLALKRRLPRAWPAFFERHGNFTHTQLVAIPPILAGENILLSAPTASGKTEAVVAPLVERRCPPGCEGLQLLYVTPTRALASDLYQRLGVPFEYLHLSLAVKTRDFNTFRKEHPSALLISTPESVDSLLTTQAQIFSSLRAVILDELHLVDGTPRGDQLRVLMNRIRAIHAYAALQEDGEEGDDLQYAALSATLPNPAETATRYFPHAQIITVEGGRSLEAELLPLASNAALQAYLHMFRDKGWRKAIVFCNTRAEAEHYAASARPDSPFGSAVYVHYSNIDARQRHEIETRFAEDEAAICFATSTLELGIDIGSIDAVILIGPPGDIRSFMQRIGRGNRRSHIMRVACFYRTLLEERLFRVFVAQVERRDLSNARLSRFRPSVAVQQIFSIMKQSPIQAVRLTILQSLFEGMVTPGDLLLMVGHLEELGYLAHARPGEWRAGPKLNRLVDEQNMMDAELSLYSNIRTEPRQVEVRDRHTGRRIARVSPVAQQHDVITLQGRSQSIKWSDGETLWVSSDEGAVNGPRLPYLSTRQHLSYEIARRLPRLFGLEPDAAPLVETPGGWWWFHWLGDLYGMILLDLLRYGIRAEATIQPGLCIFLPEQIASVPGWSEQEVRRYLLDHYRRFEPMLDLGAYYRHVPPYLAQQAVIDQIDPIAFLSTLVKLRLSHPSDDLAARLRELVG